MELPIYIKREHLSTRDVRDRLPHYHNEIELIYVLKGSMECQTNDSIFPLAKGDLCFINKGQLHHLYEKEDTSEHISIIIYTDLLTQSKEIFDTYISPMLNDLTFSHIKFSSIDGNSEKIYHYILEIEQLLKEKPIAYELSIIADIHLIFKHLYLTYMKTDTVTIIDEDSLLQQKMIQYIEDHYMEDINVDDIAKASSVSRSKCFRIFKNYTRISPITYLNGYRLEIAASKLKNTNDSVSTIALDSGFSQASYFNKLFLKEYGYTPLEYRKRNFS